jgi:hypothetical protein
VPDEFNKPVFQHNLTLMLAMAVNVPTSTIAGGIRLAPCFAVSVDWARPTADLSQIATWKMDREANQKAYGLAHHALLLPYQRWGRSLKSWAGSMQSEWLSDIFHIPEAAMTGDPATTAMGSKAVKPRMGICFPRGPR